jgi:hypothetical protein
VTSAESAVRARAFDLLARDEALAGIVHGVFDGAPPRASAPFVTVGGVEGRDWGTKDRAGREVRVTLVLAGVGGTVDDSAADRIERVVATMRGRAGGWTIVSARTIRTRLGFAREGGWRHEMIVQCRCLEA